MSFIPEQTYSVTGPLAHGREHQPSFWSYQLNFSLNEASPERVIHDGIEAIGRYKEPIQPHRAVSQIIWPFHPALLPVGVKTASTREMEESIFALSVRQWAG